MEKETGVELDMESPLPKSFLSTHLGLKTGLFLIVWFLLYRQLLPLAQFLSYDLIGLRPESHLGSAVEFFLYDTPKS
nr:hypothetical protein [Syntrophotalea acetylenivorans]